MEDPDRMVDPNRLEDPDQPAALPDQPAALSEAVDVEPAGFVEPTEAEAPAESAEPMGAKAPASPVRPKPKLPTAVTVVVAIGVIAASIYLTRGGLAALILWKCDALARLAGGAPAEITRRMVCGPEATLIDPTELLSDAIIGIGVAILMAIILVNFVRLRSWAWTALMLWGGFVLARDLFNYFVFPEERPNLYLGMLFSALIVLALNQEDVQTTFGIKREAHDILPSPGDTGQPGRSV